VNSKNPTHHIQPDVRAAISAFLNEAQRDAKPFALSDGLAAIRQIFPDMEISDSDLADAVTSEALTAGVEIEFDEIKTAREMRETSDQARKDAAQRVKTNDIVGTIRRDKATKERHRLL
jgi:hypothetical protein